MSVPLVTDEWGGRAVPRNGEKVRCRLREAALELYRERGYDQTTTPKIAGAAGVTERTFFRHSLRERELAKATALAAILATALRARGVSRARARRR